MPKLGLGAGIGRAIVHTPGVVTDGLVMKHMYNAGEVQPLSDGAVYFDGTNDEINFGATTAVGVNQFTACCWFKMDSLDSSFHIMGKGDGLSGTPYDDKGWAVTFYKGNRKIYFDVYAGSDGGGSEGGDNDIRKSHQPPIALQEANIWQHVAVTRVTSGANSIYNI